MEPLSLFRFEEFVHLLHLLASFFIYIYIYIKPTKPSQRPLVCVYDVVRVVKF